MLAKAKEMVLSFQNYTAARTLESYALALESMLDLIRALNMKVLFAVVQDLSQNIQKIRSQSPALVREGTEWATYTVQFFTQFLFLVVKHGLEPKEAGQDAYDQVLRKHHNFVQKALFQSVFHMMPSKQSFCQDQKLEIDDDVVKLFCSFKLCSEEAVKTVSW